MVPLKYPNNIRLGWSPPLADSTCFAHVPADGFVVLSLLIILDGSFENVYLSSQGPLLCPSALLKLHDHFKWLCAMVLSLTLGRLVPIKLGENQYMMNFIIVA